jgi:hypothetical protein
VKERQKKKNQDGRGTRRGDGKRRWAAADMRARGHMSAGVQLHKESAPRRWPHTWPRWALAVSPALAASIRARSSAFALVISSTRD